MRHVGGWGIVCTSLYKMKGGGGIVCTILGGGGG